ncbi:MAG TPA: Gfo/Idh/MocA family oxidoreductase [Phycisphaerae bacterium]|nr:Gfo/Idh/MocA family oxidoreductase [Phycisphaerae bacterium]
MERTIRWGVLGCGKIARKVATAVNFADGAELAAVASRGLEKAEAFAAEFSAGRAHGSYEALADDPDVDVIYVATPHAMHAEHAQLALEAGKAVLCEKPFAVNAAQARAVIDLARRRKLFLMEAMWTRFLPTLVRTRELIAEGAIGEVRLVAADFGFRSDVDPTSRLFDPALGGGALLDVGVYPVSLASMLFGGEPTDVAALADVGSTGVDEQSAYVLKYPGGRMASLFAAVRTFSPMEATIMGTTGHIRLHTAWWCGKKLSLCPRGGQEQLFELPHACNGYEGEVAEVVRCLRQGLTESTVVPLDETLAVMRTLDRIRAQWDMTYPME